MRAFGERLAAVFESSGHLCVGIDPHAFLLQEWGLKDDAAGLRDFGLRVVDASANRVGIVKPQVAFFERHGSAGFAALEDVLASARAAGLLVIADAKRGDIGSTFDAYAEAWLAPSAPLEVDAITVSTYLGIGAVAGPFGIATEYGKGLFILAATSNPEAAALQLARQASGGTVAASIVDTVHEWNSGIEELGSAGPGSAGLGSAGLGSAGLGSAGLVLGATIDLHEFGIDFEHLARTPILAPGFGHQGARVEDINRLYGTAAANVVVSASRSILAAGPSGIAAAIESQSAEVAAAFAA